MSKVMSLHDAIAKYVESGDSLCFGGFTTNRKPYAAVYEIIRQGQTDFIGYSGPAGGDWDMLIGCGRIKAFINCYIANSGYTNVCRRFRDAVEKKHNLLLEDYSQDVIMLMLHASSLGLPYLPVKLMEGSDLEYKWGCLLYTSDVSVEILSLQNHFNEMIDKIKYLREYEINALYSQINPHFLYNTLDTIIWMAEFQDTEKVISITKALSNFFRISLSNGKEKRCV